MMKHIEATAEAVAANLDARMHIVASLKAMAERIAEIGETADGAVAEQVKALDERLTALTSAVSSLGSTVSALGSSIAAAGSLTNADGKVVSLGERLAALEAKAAQAVPPAPPQA